MKLLWNTMLAATLAMTTAQASPVAVGNMQEPQPGKAADFAFGGEQNREFMLDGKPFQIRAGEMHPQRIPRQYWKQRLQAAKAMGLNAISFYVFWNGLETSDHKWDFSGSNDIAAFIDMCGQEGLWVLFRPGPFVCGEWDLGGMPTYLLKADETKLRCTANEEFMAAQKIYMEKMADIAIPRLAKNGGPILMVQLENEYGSYRTGHEEHQYMEWFKDFWTKKGAEDLFVSEGASQAQLQYTPKGVALGLNPGENDGAFDRAWQFNPEVPAFSAETYPGWIRHWGEGNWAPARGVLNSVKWFMQKGYSFNMFLVHGGTNFGLTAGSNTNPFNGTAFQPDLTSYDYGSPVGEHGNLTKEYFEYRDIIQGFMPQGTKLPEPPAVPESIDIPEFTPKAIAPLAELFKPLKDAKDSLPTLESIGQNQGLAHYSVSVPAGPAAPLHLTANDYAQVYLDGKPVGVVDRMKGQTSIDLPERQKPATLEIVLDTFGHVNYGAFIEKDRKGVIGEVKLGDQALKGWKMALLPLADNAAPRPQKDKINGACTGGIFHANVELDKPADTFIDMKDWSKGYVWVNGHLLGRYWHLGPQERLYCPANFLQKGKNSITVLDTFLKEPRPIRGCNERNMEIHKETKALNNQW